METKKNISLSLAVAIPILMIGFVAASIYLPALFAPSPAYDFLYLTGQDYQYEYFMENGKLMRNEIKQPEPPLPHFPLRGKLKIFVHDVRKNESREISFDEARTLTLDSNPLSPDGFEVVHGRGDGGFFLLFMPYSDYQTVYLKGHGMSKKLALRKGPEYSFPPFNFLGWIKDYGK